MIDRLGLGQSIEIMPAKAAASSDTVFSTQFDDSGGLLWPLIQIHDYGIVRAAVSHILKHAAES
jgi:nitrate/nitrite-specific signal transduction histidine kinase